MKYLSPTRGNNAMNDSAMNRSAEGGSPEWHPGSVKSPSSLPRTAFFGLLAIAAIGVAAASAYLVVIRAVGVATAQQPAPMRGNPQPVELVLEDQFDRKTDLGDLRGQVVILVYGDKAATEKCRKLGESLHICWHPDAKGQPPMKARTAPVVPLENLKPGQVSTDVVVVPVACCGKPPSLIRGVIRSEIAKESPDVVVWLDFADKLKGMSGLTAGEPNLLLFDVAGRLKMKINGTPDQPTMDRLVKAVQGLRYDGVK
jgi:hypothetical protein